MEELRFYSPLKILKIIKLFDVVSKEGQYSETQEDIENIKLREIKRYLTSVYMSYKIDFVDEALCKEYSYENIKTLFNKISDACKYSELYLAFHKDNGDVNEAVQLYESVDGRTYICFSYSILSALLQAQADLLQNCYHIEYKDFDDGLKKLWEQLICLQIPKQLKESELIYHVDEIVDKSNCCIEDITGWPNQLIRDLSYELGEDTSFFVVINILVGMVLKCQLQKNHLSELKALVTVLIIIFVLIVFIEQFKKLFNLKVIRC